MTNLYLIEQNTILRKQGNRLLLCKRPPLHRKHRSVLQRDIILDLPCADVGHVMLFGNIQVTTQAMQNMLKNGIEFAVFSYNGRLLGQLTPPMGKNVALRLQQYERYRDAVFALETAKKIVAAKIKNAKKVLERYHWNYPTTFSLKTLHPFSEALEKLVTAESLETLRGIEGAAAARYFRFFSSIVQPPWTFEQRSKRPPKDPVNAVLSYGYVVLGSQLQALLDGAGLDPFLGYYHQMAYGRASLALDLLEEFRHPLVDRLALRLFNKKIFKPGDFYTHASGAVFMNNSGKKKFFIQYEKMLGKATQTPQAETAKDYFPILQRQVQRIANAIKTGAVYRPYEY